MRRKLSLVLNAAIALAVAANWYRMFFAFEGGALASVRWGSLKYFTVQSNLLAGVTALITLGFLLRKAGELPRWLRSLRWAATVSVLLTFVAGLIPSGIAAKKDPVEALRTE
jgi:ABC-type lipoprotein release transport system permease subunit